MHIYISKTPVDLFLLFTGMGDSDCRPSKDPNFELGRREHSRGVQAIPDAAAAVTQTAWYRPVRL